MRRKKTLDGTGSEVDSPTGEADWRSANMDVDERVGGWLESSSVSHSPSYPSSSQYRSPRPASPPSSAPSRPRSRSRSRTPTSHQPETPSSSYASQPPQPSQELLPTPNSRWQSLIMATPGVATAVRISDDSRRRLRFVLGWLGVSARLCRTFRYKQPYLLLARLLNRLTSHLSRTSPSYRTPHSYCIPHRHTLHIPHSYHHSY